MVEFWFVEGSGACACAWEEASKWGLLHVLVHYLLLPLGSSRCDWLRRFCDMCVKWDAWLEVRGGVATILGVDAFGWLM